MEWMSILWSYSIFLPWLNRSTIFRIGVSWFLGRWGWWWWLVLLLYIYTYIQHYYHYHYCSSWLLFLWSFCLVSFLRITISISYYNCYHDDWSSYHHIAARPRANPDLRGDEMTRKAPGCGRPFLGLGLGMPSTKHL